MGTAPSFRADIEGLRAVAILAVLACHAGIAWLAGGYVGVDVFFVISGFLITRLLLDEVDRSGTISISRFYARRAKRLLPQAALLLIAVAALSLLVLSPLRGVEISGDIVSSGLYMANWHFAAHAVDYFAQGAEPSPVLHLWSLGIEEQFYLVWPALLLGLVWLGRRRGSVRPIVCVALALLFAGSLTLGIEQTAAQPAWAYFSTFDRAWELALGAALALLGSVGLPRPLAAVLGWAGLGAIAYAVLAFDAQTSFPGAVALVPTLGAAALIVSGAARRAPAKLSPATALSLPPVRYVGRISYAWYLWHWPALVFAAAIFGPLSALAGIAVVLAALLPTVVSHHLVENPLRHSRRLTSLPSRGLALGAACMASAVVAGIMLIHLQPTLHTLPAAEAKGALALLREPRLQRRATAIRPNPLHAGADLPRVYYDGCLTGIEGTASHSCLYGDPHGNSTLVLFGDSHAMQHFPAIQAVAKRNRWRLVVLAKRECTPAEARVRDAVEKREYSQCDVWRQHMLERIEASGGPVTVVLGSDTAYTAYGPHGEELSGRANAAALEAGYVATLKRLRRAGIGAVVVRDTPEAPGSVPSCVSEHMQDLGACAFPKEHRWNRSFDLRAARQVPETGLIDVTPEICSGRLCRAVIGSVLVYRDNAHLTATFSRTLSRWFEPALKRAVAR
ncbi:MAG TPA: acyltransferase family protein [Solirubrobacterales bacterium]|nr:acyltransferase family protein [Solirubrobacterales bacterium]